MHGVNHGNEPHQRPGGCEDPKLAAVLSSERAESFFITYLLGVFPNFFVVFVHLQPCPPPGRFGCCCAVRVVAFFTPCARVLAPIEIVTARRLDVFDALTFLSRFRGYLEDSQKGLSQGLLQGLCSQAQG